MHTDELTQKIMNFGLTRQEAMLYKYLVVSGESTGYEVAKEVGISRSNAYSSLTSLVDKGAAYLQNGTTNKYLAVNVSEFCGNKIRTLENDKKDLEANLKVKEETEGYVTIFGCHNIQAKIANMLDSVEQRVYISIAGEKLHLFKEAFIKLIDEKNMTLEVSESAKEFILEKGTNLKFGARPLRRAIQRYVEDEISEMILRNEVHEGQNITVNFENENLKFDVN